MNKNEKKKILNSIKGGERKPSMPSPKRFVDRKRQADKTKCRGKVSF
jgi:hypothetical protein